MPAVPLMLHHRYGRPFYRGFHSLREWNPLTPESFSYAWVALWNRKYPSGVQFTPVIPSVMQYGCV